MDQTRLQEAADDHVPQRARRARAHVERRPARPGKGAGGAGTGRAVQGALPGGAQPEGGGSVGRTSSLIEEACHRLEEILGAARAGSPRSTPSCSRCCSRRPTRSRRRGCGSASSTTWPIRRWPRCFPGSKPPRRSRPRRRPPSRSSSLRTRRRAGIGCGRAPRSLRPGHRKRLPARPSRRCRLRGSRPQAAAVEARSEPLARGGLGRIQRPGAGREARLAPDPQRRAAGGAAAGRGPRPEVMDAARVRRALARGVARPTPSR